MISIVSLIYRSPSYADAIYKSVYKHTPMLHTGEAEFFFVANDPTDKLLQHLKDKKYNYILNINPEKTLDELRLEGIGQPVYINKVYRGWNCGIRNSKDIVVLVNSDNLFSPNWLENLYKNLTKDNIVCSQLVERKHEVHALFPDAIHGEFGNHPKNFREKDFINFAEEVSKEGIKMGGAYMPCMFYKEIVAKVNYYPEGNPIINGIVAYGDKYMFEKLRKQKIKHITALDSIVYHFKEGEMDE